jgi:tetratricopeptide (TPR) repeat protein
MSMNGVHIVHGRNREPNAEIVAKWIETAGMLAMQERFEESLELLDKALELMPRSPHVHWNRAQVSLSLGDYADGFRDFQWGRYLFGDLLSKSGIPIWHGEPLV